MADMQADKTYALFATAANKKIIKQLENAAAEIHLFPPLATEKIEAAEINAGFLHFFDWLIFPDIPAVRYFLEILESQDIDFFELDQMRVCTFGEAIADELRFVQLHADVIPNTNSVGDIFSALCDYIGDDEIENLKFLVPKIESGEIILSEKLKTRGAEVLELPIYRAKDFDKYTAAKLKTLIMGGAIDEFIFSSPEDLTALSQYFSEKSIAGVLKNLKVSAVSGAMFQTLKEYNLENAAFFILPNSVD